MYHKLTITCALYPEELFDQHNSEIFRRKNYAYINNCRGRNFVNLTLQGDIKGLLKLKITMD